MHHRDRPLQARFGLARTAGCGGRRGPFRAGAPHNRTDWRVATPGGPPNPVRGWRQSPTGTGRRSSTRRRPTNRLVATRGTHRRGCTNAPRPSRAVRCRQALWLPLRCRLPASARRSPRSCRRPMGPRPTRRVVGTACTPRATRSPTAATRAGQGRYEQTSGKSGRRAQRAGGRDSSHHRPWGVGRYDQTLGVVYADPRGQTPLSRALAKRRQVPILCRASSSRFLQQHPKPPCAR